MAPTDKAKLVICCFQLGKPKKDKSSHPLTRYRTLPFHASGNVICTLQEEYVWHDGWDYDLTETPGVSVSLRPGCVWSVEDIMLLSLTPIWCPGMDDPLGLLGSANIISILDLHKVRWQTELVPETRPEGVFITPQGLYQFMPFLLQWAWVQLLFSSW